MAKAYFKKELLEKGILYYRFYTGFKNMTGVVEDIYYIKEMGRQVLKINMPKKHRKVLTSDLVDSTGKENKPEYDLKEFYGYKVNPTI